MIRKALIIYCDNTKSGRLKGPDADNSNLINHLTSDLGGHWNTNEILSLNNPTRQQLKFGVSVFLSEADYSFIVFSGHGWINTDESMVQYLEVSDGDVPLNNLLSNSRRQTILIDACRGYLSPLKEALVKGLRGFSDNFTGDRMSTRNIFDHAVMEAEEGVSILFAANENQSASDSDRGGAYTYSLLKACKDWANTDKKKYTLTLDEAHNLGTNYMRNHFITIQQPVMTPERRMIYFPLAVKFIQIRG